MSKSPPGESSAKSGTVAKEKAGLGRIPRHRKLVIVQNVPTQFDVPLYARLHEQAPFELSVYYTVAGQQGRKEADPETGRKANWDHLAQYEYPNRFSPLGEEDSAENLAQWIAAEDPALVIVCGYFPWPHARLTLALKRRGIPVGLRSDNTLPHSSFRGLKGRLKKAVLPWWLRRYDTWHPVGTLAARYFTQVAGAKRPIFLFPYNVDNDWFRKEVDRWHSEREEIRRSFGFGRDDFIVLGILKWHERENPLTLLRAFADLASKRNGVGLVLVGDGPLRNEVRREAKRIGESVVLPGYEPYSKLPMFYAASDLFVHPAVDECWGVSVNEAMACGLPVLASEGVGAAFDLLEGGRTGATFPVGDASALALEMDSLAGAPARAEEMGRNAREKISGWSYGQTLSEFTRAIERASALTGRNEA